MSLPIVILAVVLLAIVALLAFDLLAPSRAASLALRLERRRAGVHCEEIAVNGHRVCYWRGGHGAPLLLLHGFGADKDNFVRVAAHLVSRFDVIAPDLTGFGDSDRLLDADYSFSSQTDRVHDFVTAIGLSQFHIGGSSMGGAIAALYAERFPRQVLSVWLLAPAGVIDATDSEMAAEYRRSGRSLLVARAPEDFGNIMRLTMTKQPFLPPSVRRTLAARAVADAPLHERIFDQIATDPGISDAASRVAAPARIVWGENDRVLDVSGAELLRTRMPDASTWRMADTGHLPMIERPKAVARDFIEFVDQRGATSPPD